MKFRKKPVVIEAHHWNGDWEEVKTWATNVSDGNGTWLRYQIEPNNSTHLFVHTLEGVMEAQLGDIIICGINGEFYFCKPDIFEKTYEKVEE